MLKIRREGTTGIVADCVDDTEYSVTTLGSKKNQKP